MDIESLVVLFFLLTGILSSLIGGKKKKRPAGGPPRRDRAQPRPTPESPGRTTPPAPDRGVGRATMEDILAQLGLEVPSSEPAEPTTKPEATPTPALDDYGREIPTVVSLEAAAPVPEPWSETRHQAFHGRISELDVAPGRVRSPAAGLVNRRRLRQAILAQEILGPPKALRDE